MTAMQERAIEMIKHMPDEKVLYILNILQGIEGLYSLKGDVERADAQAAYKRFQSFRKEGDVELDYKQELRNAWEEKYESSDRY